MTIQNLIIFEILAPILIGALGLLNKRPTLAFYLVLLTTIATSVVSVLILKNLIDGAAVVHYHFGGWAPPVGIEFKVNKLNASFLAIISFSASLTFLYGKKILFLEVNKAQISLLCSVFLISLAGMYGMILTNDFFNLYVFIEITSLTSYSLLHLSSDRKAIKAAFDYLVVGTIAATLILIGIGYLYVASGTLNIDDFIKKLPEIKTLKTVRAGYFLILAGLIIKAALFPLHSWMIKVYRSTNSFVLPFIGSISTKIYALLALKVIYFVFGPEIVLQNFLLIAGVFAAIIGTLSAFYQKDLRSMLAFSSASQIGYIFIAIAVGTSASMTTAVIFICSHILAALALFMLCGYIHYYKHTYNLHGLSLLYKEMPWAVILFIINAASLVGIPLTFGFIAKMKLVLALADQKMWIVIAVIAATSFITFMYLWKFIRGFLFYKDSSPALQSTPNTNRLAFGVISIITFVNLSVGILFSLLSSRTLANLAEL